MEEEKNGTRFDNRESNPYKQWILEEGGQKLAEGKIHEAFEGLPKVSRVTRDQNMTKTATLDRTVLK